MRKAQVQKLLGTAVVGLALLTTSLPVWAGQKYTPEVTIGPNSASGSMVGARYSSDSNQYIHCALEAHKAFAAPSAVCSARDKTGKTFVCFSNGDSRWTTAVQAITDSAFITIEGSGDGSCHSLTIENYSRHLR